MWCIPPEQDAAFVCAMENVLEVYHRPYDSKRPVVCLDEKPQQLVKETRLPLPAQVGAARRYDYEYERNGTANLFMMVEPLRGWRQVNVTRQRTKVDFALQVRELVEVHYPEVEKITLVMDNLNTHRMSSLYEAFPPVEARRLIDRLEVVYTPRHGSWLNMAEIEINVIEKQVLAGRVPDKKTLRQRVRVWNGERNGCNKRVNWQFTTADARIKLRRLYPKIES